MVTIQYGRPLTNMADLVEHANMADLPGHANMATLITNV
jgi:hypothetical protein